MTHQQTAVPSEDGLQVAESELRRAQFTNDVEALDRLLDDALVFTGPDGALYGKADDLHAHRHRWLRLTRLEPGEEHVQRFGDIAVVSVCMRMAGSFKDTPIDGSYRYTRVWSKRPDGWRIVAGHVSAVLG
jgi:ketosteroid isomerase-like protein